MCPMLSTFKDQADPNAHKESKLLSDKRKIYSRSSRNNTAQLPLRTNPATRELGLKQRYVPDVSLRKYALKTMYCELNSEGLDF